MMWMKAASLGWGKFLMHATMKSLGIDQLSVDERMLLLEEIWDSIAAHPDDVAVTEAQKQDSQARLDAYRDNPKASSRFLRKT
jgi:putative addiction module component (TIGR02574 family)